jgi:hypothetical protein
MKARLHRTRARKTRELFTATSAFPDAKRRNSISPASPDAQTRGVREWRFTDYFETRVLTKRPYLKRAWRIQVLENSIRSEPQEGNRWRFWAAVPEMQGRYLRVVTLADKVTIHNAFLDRRFRP